MTFAIDVVGLDQLVRQLDQAHDDLTSLETVNLQAARLVADDAVRRTPRRTGQLAAGTRATATRDLATISNVTRYAAPVHGGVPSRNMKAQPWLLDTTLADEARVVELYADEATAITERITGR